MANTSFHALFFAERATVPIVNPPARLSMLYPAKRAQPRRIAEVASRDHKRRTGGAIVPEFWRALFASMVAK